MVENLKIHLLEYKIVNIKIVIIVENKMIKNFVIERDLDPERPRPI
jgi:hypothetical protein